MDSKNKLEEGLRTTQRRAQSQSRSMQKEPPKCPECINGFGWVEPPYFDENGNRNSVRTGHPCGTCESKRLAEKRALLQDLSKMSTLERQYRFSDIKTNKRPDTEKMMSVFRDYMDNGAVGFLTVYGTRGNGKSHVLIATVNECLQMGVEAVYITAPDMLNWIQNAFNENRTTKDGTALDRLNRLKEIRMLAIDELQAIKLSDWRVEQLENLVDYRWKNGMDRVSGTLFAMNEHPDELKSDRIYSRIMTGSEVGDTVLENNDSDIRPFLKMRAA